MEIFLEILEVFQKSENVKMTKVWKSVKIPKFSKSLKISKLRKLLELSRCLKQNKSSAIFNDFQLLRFSYLDFPTFPKKKLLKTFKSRSFDGLRKIRHFYNSPTDDGESGEITENAETSVKPNAKTVELLNEAKRILRDNNF